jgi:micrococcal nuclease
MKTLIALLLLSTGAHAAKVIEVHSGDTLTLMEQQKPVRIHLAKIDAPEPDQPYGNVAKKSLETMCKGKEASYQSLEKSATGELFASVMCDGVDAERAQLKQGLAWVRPQSVVDPSFTLIQDFVWRDKTGLWADANPVPPWEWAERKK